MIRIERLAGHDRSRFERGVAELNTWLRTQASQQQRKDNAVTFVALHPDDGRVVGYYSSLTYRLDLDEAAAASTDSRAICGGTLSTVAVCVRTLAVHCGCSERFARPTSSP